MTWFKVDDGFAFHPKAIAAGNAALGLWVRAGCWCNANLTGGALPGHMIGTFGAQRRDAMRLVSAGLWCETEDGYQFNSFHDYQPTKVQVEAERKAGRERQARHREAKRHAASNGVTPPVSNAVSNRTPARPDPTVAPSGATGVGARKRGTRLPDDWAITTELRDWVVDQGITPEFAISENKKFVDYFRAVPGLKGSKLDWPATWRNWIRRAAEDRRPRPGTDPVGRLERTLGRIAARDAGPKELP